MKVLSSMVWVCLIALFVSVVAQAADGLMLWNKLGSDEEVSNSEVGENGTVVGTSHAYEPGMFGNGYVRKAVGNNYVLFPHAVVADLKNRGSLELWINPKVPKPIPYDYGIFGFPGTWYRHYEVPRCCNVNLGWGDTGIWGFINFDDDNLAITSSEPTQFVATPGIPFHVAISWDINGINGTVDKVRAYRDGKVVGSTADNWDPSGTTEYDLIFGYGPDSGGYDKYIVDNLKVWNFAKTDFSDRFDEDPTDYSTFAEFSIDRAALRFRIKDSDGSADATNEGVANAETEEFGVDCADSKGADTVLLRASFVLGETSEGIDPINDEMTVTVGSYTLTIPSGSFVMNGGYRYRGTIDGAKVFAQLRDDWPDAYDFYMKVQGIDLADTANPVSIRLEIGNDGGEVEERLQGVLTNNRLIKRSR